MSGFEDDLMTAILDTLSEKVELSLLQKANTKALKKKLLKCITNELFYKLLSEQRVDLAPGFGSLVLRDIREKDKKIFDKKTQAMVVKHVRGKKVIYKPGDVVREFL